ncbi:MAG: hypothetical protein K5660_09645 [Paludibacteraceae bacterium]|nr:hypothetical protein [Paludibacteraceae bacterium]
MEKNTGKTVTLNYLLDHLPSERRVAVTSIGLDGESQDQVTQTRKPEIELREGMLFATSEKHYRMRKMVAEIIDVSQERTALGRLVTAEVKQKGKVILSGPGSSQSVRRWMDETEGRADLIIVDGALSRKSVASPTVSESMILSTGAAYSANMEKLVRDTAYIVELIQLPKETEGGEEKIYLTGAVTNRVLESILGDKTAAGKEVVIQDFTRVFAEQLLWHRFCKVHRVSVQQKSRLLAITVNPTAPNGMVLDSDKLCKEMFEATGVATYDLVKKLKVDR